MNQRSKKGGHANAKSVDEVPRGATRPAAVVAIVLCVGFAVALVGIWSCRKPASHQETQTQLEAAVQTETPSPETEAQEPEAVSSVSVPPRAVPLESSTATPVSQASPATPLTAAPVSQASPAARQSMDDHVNSPASVQDNSAASVQDNSAASVQNDQSYDFSHQLNAETITFEAVNPRTQIPGRMTVTITGIFSGNRLWDGESSAGSHLEADQAASFLFVPYDRYSPSYSATVGRLQVAGNTTDDSIHLDFGLATTGSDGSSLQFTLREVVTITEDSAQVAFEQLK